MNSMKCKWFFFRRRKTGFTLVEILITCVIIAILIGIAIPAYLRARFRFEEGKAVTQLYAYYQAEKLHFFENDGQYEDDFTVLENYVDLVMDDDVWQYSVDSVDNSAANIFDHTFLIEAEYRDDSSRTLTINQDGSITPTNWPPF